MDMSNLVKGENENVESKKFYSFTYCFNFSCFGNCSMLNLLGQAIFSRPQTYTEEILEET